MYIKENRNALRALQRYFPLIKRFQFKNKFIYYLENKNKLALKGMMKKDTTHIILFKKVILKKLVKMSPYYDKSTEIKVEK